MSATEPLLDEPEAPAPLTARKLSLRVSGARVGDAVRPTDSGAPAAGAMQGRTPRLGLRVHGRGTLPPPIRESATTARAAEADDAPFPWEGQP